jgi:hypothetical protein
LKDFGFFFLSVEFSLGFSFPSEILWASLSKSLSSVVVINFPLSFIFLISINFEYLAILSSIDLHRTHHNSSLNQ